jgi:hypothetical protein
VTPLLFVAASSAIVLNALFTQTGRALIGIAVVLTGAPAYLVWRSRMDRQQRDGVDAADDHTHTTTP